jgi:hypothetical protein
LKEEVNRAIAEDTNLANKILEENERAIAAEDQIRSSLTEKDDELSSLINAEKTRA